MTYVSVDFNSMYPDTTTTSDGTVRIWSNPTSEALEEMRAYIDEFRTRHYIFTDEMVWTELPSPKITIKENNWRKRIEGD